MSIRSRRGQGKRAHSWVAAIVAVLLLALSLGSPSGAVSFVTVDDHPEPIVLVEGETVVIHCDVSEPGRGIQYTLARDLTGDGRFDPRAPAVTSGPVYDGGNDTDPAPGEIAFPLVVYVTIPAGRYVLRFHDLFDRSSVDVPCTIVPKPQPQAISGRVAVASDSSVPSDAIIWANKDLGNPVASAHIQPDGSYTLPLPPGTYRLFAEWFDSLRSQWQVVNVHSGKSVSNLNLPLLHGQEVSGGVMNDAGEPLAYVPVQARATDGTIFTVQTFDDGSYVLVLPNGDYTVTAQDLSKRITVADEPVDQVDFPDPVPPPAPSVGDIVTVAGNGAEGFGGDGGPAVNARLSNPLGIGVDKKGNLYIVQSIDGHVRKVDTTGRITTVAGSRRVDSIRGLVPQPGTGRFSGDGGPATEAQFNTPQHLAVDRAGNLHLSDLFNQRVRKVDGSGIITTVAGSGLVGPEAGAFAGDGGRATAARLAGPQGVAVDGAGNLFIVDGANHRVRKVSPAGIITTVAGGGTRPVANGVSARSVVLPAPLALAVDLTGNLYVTDLAINRILKMTPDGILHIVAGTGVAGFSGDHGPATRARISTPAGVAVDSAGNLFFADLDNHRIRKISPDGIITTVAGSGPAGLGTPGSFAGDGGPATLARLDSPVAVAIDTAGNLFFSELGNSDVREVIGIAAPSVLAGE
jgi:NHL repeat-containing protein